MPGAFKGIPKMDRRISIQTQSAYQAADGAQLTTWTTVATVWAAKEDFPESRRGQYFQAGQFNDLGYTQFTIRYYSGLTGAERIVCEGIIYQVFGAPIEIGRRQWTQILAQRGFAK